jgi:hypothetical protein
MDFLNSAYRCTPPWDIGRPQKEVAGLVRRGEISGSVLDIGCGTGEHALFFAEEGHEVCGIDSAPWRSRKRKRRLPDEDSWCISWSVMPGNSPGSTGSLIPPPIQGSSLRGPMKTARSSWKTLQRSCLRVGNVPGLKVPVPGSPRYQKDEDE